MLAPDTKAKSLKMEHPLSFLWEGLQLIKQTNKKCEESCPFNLLPPIQIRSRVNSLQLDTSNLLYQRPK